MKKLYNLFLLLLLILTTLTIAQRRPGGQGGRMSKYGIKGTIVDKSSGNPMEYANIIAFNSETKEQAAGIVTDSEGKFHLKRIRPGSYYVEISFIGFEKQVIKDIEIKFGNIIDLETIQLSPQSYGTDDVVVESNRAPVTYEIDKKVINVSEQLTSASGSAVDILENVPSVTVDIEGNVSLRGSENFTVLIDGRPTILQPAEILEQIPASSIESIEIITNPSAKFDPEGSAGIMNLLLKKNKRAGFSSLMELNGGLEESYGGQALIDYKKDWYKITVGADYRHRYGSADTKDETRRTPSDVTYYNESEGERSRSREHFGVRAELGLDLTDADFLTIGGRYRDRDSDGETDLTFYNWNQNNPDKNIYSSVADRNRGGDQFEAHLNYEHRFAPKGHNIIFEVQYESDNSDEENINKLLNSNSAITDGQITTESGPGTEFEAKLDYVYNPTDAFKFESGYKTEFEDSEEATSLSYYNPASGLYEIQSAYSNFVNYKKNEHAVYSLLGGEYGRLGYQGGIRGEYTDREITAKVNNETYKIDRWDWFPTAHMSFQISDGHQLMASYTRRINRPRSWYLEPFETWMDAYNVRIGNAGLEPEYVNSYEFGYQAMAGKAIFSTEVYFREVNNKIERLRSSYDNPAFSDTLNITLHSIDNVGKSTSLGAELMVNFDPVKNWNMNLMGNLFDYNIKGNIPDEGDFERTSFNWSIRFNNMIKLWESTRFQFNAIYNSPSVSSQGEREGFYMMNLAVRHEVIKGLLSATLQFRDVLNQAKFEYTSESAGYYSYSYRDRYYPQISLNLRFTFNRQQNQREGGGGREGGGFDEMDGGEQ